MNREEQKEYEEKMGGPEMEYLQYLMENPTNEVDTYNETILEAQEGDFYTFLEAEDWRNAQAIIDNLWDLGKDAKAEELRRAYLRAQTEVSLGNRHFAPKDNPLNTVKVQMDVITSELNPNRGDAPY